MKKFSFALLFTFFACAVCWATDAPIAPPTTEEIQAWIKALGGVKGAGSLGIVLLVVQGVAMFLRTQYGNLAGIYRLLILTFLAVVGGIVAMKLSGASWLVALTAPATLASMQVFVHQIINQFQKKGTDAALATSAPAAK